MSFNLQGRDLKEGCKGNDVAQLQTALYQLGYNLGATGDNSDGVDEIFGPKTRDAVKAFQAEHNDDKGSALEVDGVVGPKTEWAINATFENLTDFLEDGALTTFYVAEDTLFGEGMPLPIRGPESCHYKIYVCAPKLCT